MEAIDAEGGDRDGAPLVEITGLFAIRVLADHPPLGIASRRERVN